MKTKKVKFFLSLVGVIVFAIAAGVVVRVLATGPTGSAGSGYGAISTDAYGDVGVGTSTIPSSNPSPGRVFIVATSTVPYTIEILPVSGVTPNFKIDNSGNVTAATFVGALNGTVGANNVSNGVFGAGNFGFPSSLGVATSSQVGLPQALSVYGGGYFSGSVGIGTPGPDSLLHVNGGQIDITGSTFGSGSGLTLGYVSGTNGYIQTYASKPLYINPLGNNVILNSGGGSVGIGTTGPGYKLDVQGGQINASGGYCINGANCITSWPSGNVGTVTSITAGTGLSGGTITGSGTVAVTYGATAGTAAQGNVTHTGPAAGAGLSGGGGVLAVGTTGTFNTISLNLSSANTWTAYQTFSSGLSATAIIDSVLPSQNCIGTSGTGQLQAGVCGATAVSAGNVTAGVFGSLQGNGNFAAPASFGVATSSQVGLPQSLSVYGGGYFSGNVGIGTTAPAQKLSVAGTIQSTSGGIMFPDGTTQTTAASGSTVVTAGNVSAGTFGSNTGGGNYAFSGNVGIGATTASVKLVVSGAANASSPTLGSAAVGESALLSNNGLYGLYSGVSNDGDVWMQAQRNDAGTSVYNILLNPNGGNVGIGTTGPSGELDVYADNIASATAGDITLEHPTSGGASSIIFPSRSNYGSDYGFITYYDENTTYAYWGTSAENSALVIGSQNDGMNSFSDVVALQGDAADVIGTAAYPSTMIVNAANNVGIGTTAPGQKLDVAGGYIRSDTGYCIGGSCITGWPSGAVTSVFGRSGAVVAASGDYSVAQVTGAAPLASPSFTGTLALPATYGGASFTDGGGDAASYSADTIELSSWQGLGMYNPTSGGAYTNQISGFYDFRNGFWDTKAYPRVNGTAINSIFAPLANPTFTGNLTVAGNLSVGNKITATTFDPVYTIGGTNYATYLPGMTGVKEETAGTLDLQRNSDGSYSSTINFASEPTGGDLWLFAKATDMPGAMSQLVVSLTPSFSGNVWYEKNAALGTLTIHGSAAGEVSYNLTAPRFDASQWTNIGDPNAKGLLIK